MPRRTTQPEILPTLEIVDDLKHPMWRVPAAEANLPKHIRNLRIQIARALTLFDGRPDYDLVIAYLARVYEASERTLHTIDATQGTRVWMLGQVVLLRVEALDRIHEQLAQAEPVDHRLKARHRILRSNRTAIEQQCEHLVMAVAKGLR